MSYNDAANSVRMVRDGRKDRISAREDVEFQYRTGGITDSEYHGLMDSLGVAPCERRMGAKAYGINAQGVPFYVRGTGSRY